LRRIALPPVDQLAVELGRHELVTPLIAPWPNPSPLECGNRCLKAGIITPVSTIIVPTIVELKLCSGQALSCLTQKWVFAFKHGRSVANHKVLSSIGVRSAGERIVVELLAAARPLQPEQGSRLSRSLGINPPRSPGKLPASRSQRDAILPRGEPGLSPWPPRNRTRFRKCWP